jgi:hypothetical protein
MVEKLGLKLLHHPHRYHVQWINDSGDIKIRYRVKVPFNIGEYIDTVECNVVPMIVCHLLLGRPWQYYRSSLHYGCLNQYTIKWKGKEMVLKLMTLEQIDVNHLQKSENHKPNMIEKKERRGREFNHDTHHLK